MARRRLTSRRPGNADRWLRGSRGTHVSKAGPHAPLSAAAGGSSSDAPLLAHLRAALLGPPQVGREAAAELLRVATHLAGDDIPTAKTSGRPRR
jgi:hypothetical protein